MVDIEGIVVVESIGIIGIENFILFIFLIGFVVKVDVIGFVFIFEFEGWEVFIGDLKVFFDDCFGGDIIFFSGFGNDEIFIVWDVFIFSEDLKDVIFKGYILDGGVGNDELIIIGDVFSDIDVGYIVIGGEGNDSIFFIGVVEGFIVGYVVNSFDLINEVGGVGDDDINISGDVIGDFVGYVVFGGVGEDDIFIGFDKILVVLGNGVVLGVDFVGYVVFVGDDDDIVWIIGDFFISDSVNGFGYSVEGGIGDDLIEISGDVLIVDLDSEIIVNLFFDDFEFFDFDFFIVVD